MDEIRFNPTPIAGLVETPNAGPAGGQAEGSFLGTLKEAIAETNELQLKASDAIESMVTGGDQSVHQTMVAMQKADISFQLMMQVRNKIVAAYQEIQRMQI